MEWIGNGHEFTNSSHGDNSKVEGGGVALPEVDVAEVGIGEVAHLEGANPSVGLVGGGDGGGQIVEDAGRRVGAVKLNNEELDNPGAEIVDPNVLLEPLEELGDSAGPVEPDPQQIADELFSAGGLVDVVPGEAAEEVEGEAGRLEVAPGDAVAVVDDAVGVGVAVRHEEAQHDVDQERELPRDVQQEYLLREASEESELHWGEEGGVHRPYQYEVLPHEVQPAFSHSHFISNS